MLKKQLILTIFLCGDLPKCVDFRARRGGPELAPFSRVGRAFWNFGTIPRAFAPFLARMDRLKLRTKRKASGEPPTESPAAPTTQLVALQVLGRVLAAREPFRSF